MPVIFVVFSALVAAGLATLVLLRRDKHATHSLRHSEAVLRRAWKDVS